MPKEFERGLIGLVVADLEYCNACAHGRGAYRRGAHGHGLITHVYETHENLDRLSNLSVMYAHNSRTRMRNILITHVNGTHKIVIEELAKAINFTISAIVANVDAIFEKSM